MNQKWTSVFLFYLLAFLQRPPSLKKPSAFILFYFTATLQSHPPAVLSTPDFDSIITFSSSFFPHFSWLSSCCLSRACFIMANAEKIHNCFKEECIKSNITAHPQPHPEICNRTILFQVKMEVANYFVPWCDIFPIEIENGQILMYIFRGLYRFKAQPALRSRSSSTWRASHHVTKVYIQKLFTVIYNLNYTVFIFRHTYSVSWLLELMTPLSDSEIVNMPLMCDWMRQEVCGTEKKWMTGIMG